MQTKFTQRMNSHAKKTASKIILWRKEIVLQFTAARTKNVYASKEKYFNRLSGHGEHLHLHTSNAH